MARQTEYSLPAGKVLTVTAPQNYDASVHRVAPSGDTATNYPVQIVTAGQTLVIGPFTADHVYAVVSESGAPFTANVSQPDQDISTVVYPLKGEGPPDAAVQAALSTNLTGNNNDLVFTAVPVGTAGNAITVQYIDPAHADISLSVAIVGNAIRITLATDSGGTITTIADDISALTDFNDLVTVADKAANDGSGLVIAMAPTRLANGADATGAGVADVGSVYVDYDAPTIYVNTGTKAAPVWEQITAV